MKKTRREREQDRRRERDVGSRTLRPLEAEQLGLVAGGGKLCAGGGGAAW